MMTPNTEGVRIHHTRLDASGRVVLPREMRDSLQLSPGDPVLMIEDGRECRITTAGQSLAEAQAYFSALVPPDVSLVDSLLAERRAEAERE